MDEEISITKAFVQSLGKKQPKCGIRDKAGKQLLPSDRTHRRTLCVLQSMGTPHTSWGNRMFLMYFLCKIMYLLLLIYNFIFFSNYLTWESPLCVACIG